MTFPHCYLSSLVHAPSESVKVPGDVVVHDPASGEELYRFPEAPSEEVEAAYANAREAGKALRRMTVRQRLDELLKLKRYILANKETMLDQICAETGKSRTDALMTEIFASLDLIDYYDKTAERTLADARIKTPLVLFGKKSKVYFEPMGTVLIIAPWNYPFVLSFQPFICAFVAGNPVIMKPSSYTPIKGVYEAMIEQSGFMPNALQVVYGTRLTGGKLIDAKPSKICFTGSVGAGRKVMEQAAQHLIPVELELGGKDPAIVFDDVNIERTVNGVLWGAFVNSGQTCTSIERVLIQEGIYDRFSKALADKLGNLRSRASCPIVEDPGELEMGCMTTEFQIRTIEEQLEDAVAKGAEILTGGKREPGSHAFPPTVVGRADGSMEIVAEESFGPVIALTPFKTEEEAIELANDSPYGLSASVWTANLERADRVARALDTGNVSINNALATQANGALPFGGVKDSGFGRYKGALGLHSFCNVKSILVDRQSSRVELNWYPYSRQKYRLLSETMDALFAGGLPGLLKALVLALRLDRLGKRHRL